MPPAKRKRGSPANSSKAIDEQLARYRAMRNFDVTQEPAGNSRSAPKQYKKTKAAELPFVIQKHAATRLHYDFRLGWRGVLKSWAVTKGPSYYPGDKRLAVQVEDHPIEYGGFEGIIPKGQYGGGTVMLWDQGTWLPHGNVDESLAAGRLKFTLYGKKLKGDWALIRMGGKAAQEKKPNWLLIKEHDKYERTSADPAVTDEQPDSVVTGRDLDAIAENQDHVWGTHGSREPTGKTKESQALLFKRNAAKAASAVTLHSSRTKALGTRVADSELKKIPKEALPEFISPQLALAVNEAPQGADWIHELKLDGYRIQVRIDRSKPHASSSIRLLTRSGLDWTRRMPEIRDALANLPVKTAILDGEVVVLDEKGATSFARLQAAFQNETRQELTYFVFDLLHLDGHNLRGLPLQRRKEILEKLLILDNPQKPDPQIVRYSEHLGTQGPTIFAKACQLGAEGIISKKISSAYSSGRDGAWLKIKCVRQQEFVIGGFTLPSKGGKGIGALLLGYYNIGKLVYAGRTGTGFTHKASQNMRSMLEAARQPASPFASLPSDAAQGAHWVQPKFVAEVGFATWTADNIVRQAAFKGLREDKPAKTVKREEPQDLNGSESSAATLKKDAHATSRVSHPPPQKRNPTKSSSNSEEFPTPLTHPDKQVDAESKLTKRALADYFWAVREHILPHIAHRPLSIVRCPRGSTQPCFFQKHVTGNLPKGIEGIEIRGRKSGVVEKYITLSTPLALAGLAQMGVLEIHPWGSTNTDIEKPDQLIFDLDPDETIRWRTLAESAEELRTRLLQCKLESFLKTTGGKGLHVVAPIRPNYEWPVIKKFALALALQMEADNSRLYLTKMTKAARRGKIYIDYLRNERGATAVAPFSPRARHGAPVAMPLDWKELDVRKIPRFLVANFSDWKTRLHHDPWQAMLNKHQSLTASVLKKFEIEP